MTIVRYGTILVRNRTNRRKFLSIIGGGVIVAAAGSTAFHTTRTPGKALASWGTAGNYDDIRKWALSYALLAPNPHNRQPWEVDLSVVNQVTIYRDKSKNLPHTNPFQRQLTIVMVCFLELMSIAASNANYVVAYELFPEGENGPIAIARFSQGVDADPLFADVLQRRSCKKPFSEKVIPADLVKQLSTYANIITDTMTVDKLRKLTWEAWMIEANTPPCLARKYRFNAYWQS